MRLDRRELMSFDWLWFLSLLGLSLMGVLTIWSTTQGTGIESYLGRQVLYLGFAVLLFLFLLYFDYHLYTDYIGFLYLAGVLVLILVLIFGKTVHSSRSWIALGAFSIQPSEFMKVLVIIALAKYYADSERDYLELPELVVGGLIFFVPMLLVMLQGDLGTAVMFVPIFVVLSFMGGLRRKYVLITLFAILIASPLGWMMLKDYQRGRIQTVFNPSNDPLHMGYQTIQSKIAIGSGRVFGKGFKQGSQSQLGFIPARHTDFVFAVLSEEKGFLGSTTALALFLLVFQRLLKTARESKDRVGTMIVIGVLTLFLFHLLINVGMVLGLLPIAGIPLPFLSAGGSSLISSFVAMSLCMNVRMRRYVN